LGGQDDVLRTLNVGGQGSVRCSRHLWWGMLGESAISSKGR